MKNPGIHVRLLLAAFLLISTTTLMLGYMGVHIAYEFVKTRFEERMQFLAKYLALNAELGILIDERAILIRLARNLLSEKDVVRVTILDSFGEILAEESKDISDELSDIEIPVYATETPEESLSFQWTLNGRNEAECIGKVRIAYTKKGIDRLFSLMKIRFIWLSIGLSVFAILIFYFISHSIVAPVMHLVRSVRKVAQGDLAFRVTPQSLPETRNLAVAINVMLDSLEKSQKALEEANQKMVRQKTLAEMGKFSMMIAHEVKNPLSIIKSSLDLLKKDVVTDSGNMMVDYMDDEIKRINRLIEDFLLFAKPVMPNFRTVDLNRMLNDTLNRFQLRIFTKEDPVQIETVIESTPCIIEADPDLINRAIDNILKNAIEAIDRNGIISVKAGQNGSVWRAEIADRGIGIDPENIEKIFEPFFTTRSKGTGLGLAFASQVVRSHGGTIMAENRDAGGATFTVSIPLTGR